MNAKMNNGQMKEVLKRHKNFDSAAAISQFGHPAQKKLLPTLTSLAAAAADIDIKKEKF